MTVNVDDRRKVYDGDGVTTVFNGPMAYSATHISAGLVEVATGAVSSAGAFTVTQLGKSNGTRVVMTTPPPSGYRLVLLRTLPYSQIVDITNQGSFNTSVIEQGLDLLDMQIQQIADDSSRVPRLGPLDVDGSGRYDGNGNRLGNLADGALGGDAVTLGQLGGLIGNPQGLFVQGGADAVPRTMQDKARDTVSVKDFGAVGDGTTDDTLALQRAVNRVQGTGIRLYVPAGRYRLTSRVTVSDNCYIFGDGWNDVRDITGPTTRNWLVARPYGSIIFMDFTNATATEAFYIIGGGVTIEAMEFEDNQGDPTSGGWTPNTNQPWAIRAYRAPFQEPGGNTIHIRDVMLRNCYQGIKLEGVFRGHLDGVYGQPLRYGIYIDGIVDALRLENIHLGWTFWGGGAVYTWQLANGEAIVLGKLDNPMLHNVFCFGYLNSIRCFYSTTANPVGGISRLHGTNIGLDNTFCGIKVDDACDLDLSNVYIYAGAITGSRCIHAVSSVGGIDSCGMKLSNCDLTGANYEAIRLEIDGYVQMSNSSIRSYNQSSTGRVGIFAGDGMSVDINNVRLANGGGGAMFGTAGTGVVRGEYENGSNIVYSPRVFAGTCNGSGEADFAHGLGATLPSQLLTMQCAYKDVSDQWIAMTPTYANATNLKFSAGVSGRPYRCTILYAAMPVPGW